MNEEVLTPASLAVPDQEIRPTWGAADVVLNCCD